MARAPLAVLLFASSIAAISALSAEARTRAARASADDVITITVTTTADSGEGSLRDAIELANEACGPTGPRCRIAFAFAAAVTDRAWQTIRPLSPLPAVGSGVTIDGASAPDTNPLGPDVEIRGSAGGPAVGLVVGGCDSVVTGLAMGGFGEYGIRVEQREPCPIVDGQVLRPAIRGNFIGSDPTGTVAVANGLRGIGIFFDDIRGVDVEENVIGGNTRSGIWVQGGSNHLITRNRIGLAAHGDSPLPNFASGIYVAPESRDVEIVENAIAFNGEWGIALHPRAFRVSIRRNSIHSHFALGIDYGLDFVTPNEPDTHVDLIYGYAIPNHPLLTSARYDPASNTTRVEGILDQPVVDSPQLGYILELFASAAPDHSGHGEGALFAGSVQVSGGAFTLVLEGDLTGRFLTATSTVIEQIGFAKPQPNTLRTGFWEKTSEFSNAVQVTR